MEQEIWKPVVGYEGLYEVSNLGNVRSVTRTVWQLYKYNTLKGKPMKLSFDKYGYLGCTLSKNGKQSHGMVHRMVAEAFLPNPNGFPVVDHINDNPKDNRSCNLQWCTQKTNNSKPHHIEATSRSSKGRIPYNRRKVVQLTPNMTFVRSYEYMTLAKDDGFHYSGISMAIHGKIPLYKGYKWMYLSDYEKSLVNQ